MDRNRKTIIAVAAVLVIVLLVYVLVIYPQTGSSAIPITIKTYGEAWNGIIAFDILGTVNATVVMYTNGTIVALRQSPTNYGGATYNLAADTLLFEGEPTINQTDTPWPLGATHFWNFSSNSLVDFPNVFSEHDLQYNPVNNTFLTLRDYVRQVGNNFYLYDRLSEVDANGTVLWTWDTYDYPQLRDGTRYFNETIRTNKQQLIDATHCNSIDWDYENGVIYLNSRVLNAFYKINQTTGDIIWTCGQDGNFTLLNKDGAQVSNFWFHSHNTKQIAPGVFTMFDNDYKNVTNPDNCHSRLLELAVNETSMTAQELWSWEAPKAYWNYYAGATVKLPNGDYLGCFGDPNHQRPENKPWNFTNTGAVFVEVNPLGQVVRTWTFPVDWYSYRVEAVTNLTAATNPTVQPTPNAISQVTFVATAVGVVIAITTLLGTVFYLRKRRLAKRFNEK